MSAEQNKKQNRTATIVNVARLADVSVGTVSRFLNGYQIKTGNRERIEKAIRDLSYSRNAFASAMKSEASNMVGLLVPDYDEFHAQLLGNLVTTLRREGIITLTYCHESNQDGFRDAIDFFRTHRVKALIMSDLDTHDESVLAMMNQGVQIISYDNDPESSAVDKVTVNNRKITHQAITQLLELGHRRIGIITGAMENWTAHERLAGYQDAYKSFGLTAPDELTFNGQWTRQSGHDAMDTFWQLDDKPTAIFGSNHQMTLGVLAFARANNIVIPDDISLISFDDIEMFQYLTPSVTAIEQPVHKIAGAIKQLLLRRLDPLTQDQALEEVLECQLILRESVRPHDGG